MRAQMPRMHVPNIVVDSSELSTKDGKVYGALKINYPANILRDVCYALSVATGTVKKAAVPLTQLQCAVSVETPPRLHRDGCTERDRETP
jgi:hypothetical protein